MPDGPAKPSIMKPFLYACLIRGLLIEAASGLYASGQRFLSSRQVCAAYRVSASTAVRALAHLVECGVLKVREKCPHVLARGGSERAKLLLADFPVPDLTQTVRMARVWDRVGMERRIGQRVAFIGNAPFDSDVVYRGILAGAAPGDDPRNFGGGWPHATFLREMGRNFFEVDFYCHDGTEESQKSILDSMRDKKTVGAAVFHFGSSGSSPALLEAFKLRRIPAVVLFGDCQGFADASVDFNNLATGYAAARLLVDLGHRDILCVLPALAPRRFLERVEGARRFIGTRKGDSPAIRLREVRLNTDESIPNDLGRMFRSKSSSPTAVLCTGLAYFGALAGLFGRCRVKVPQDVSVVGCGVPEWLDPAFHWLDYFYMDFGKVGEVGAASLVKLIEKVSVPHTTLVDMPHVPGRSLAPARAPGERRSKAVQKYRRKRR